MVEPQDRPIVPSLTLPPLRSTAVVGVGSLLSLALSVVAMKGYALLVGPDGVGLLALMQSVVNLGVIVTSLGVATSVIAALAGALGTGDRPRAQAVERGAVGVGLIGGLVGALVVVLAREPFAELALGSRGRSGDVILLAAAILFTVAAVVQIALLTGEQRIRDVTAISVGTAVAAAGVGIVLVWLLGDAGLAPAILAAALVQFGLSWLVRAHGAKGPTMRDRMAALGAARNLLRLGLPVAVSQLAGAGAAFLVPLLVLQSTGQTDVGLYRAAAALSVGYLTFFLSALTQDYLPRISAARDSTELALLIERRMRIVLGLGVPMVVGLLAVGPWLIELLYSRQFADAFGVLQWQLIGDLLRLPAWVLAFVLLARRKGATYFAVEITGGMSLLIATLVGLRAFGLPGAGIGYAVSQAVYFLTVWIIVRRQVPTAPGRLQAVAVSITVGCAALLAADVGAVPRLIVLGTASVALAGVAWPWLYRLHSRGDL